MFAIPGGDDLQVSEERGGADQAEEDEVEAGPEPAVTEGGQTALQQRDAGQPEPAAGVVGQDRGAGVDPQTVLRRPQQAEGERQPEQQPQQVAAYYGPAVANQVVAELGVSRESRDGAQPQLEGEHHLCGGGEPELRLGEAGPVRGQQGDSGLGWTVQWAVQYSAQHLGGARGQQGSYCEGDQ